MITPPLIALLAASPASALPPDPGNTCGGRGSCESEAQELEFWEDSCAEVSFDEQQAHDEYYYCQLTQSNCQLEQNAWLNAMQLVDYVCGETDSALDALTLCINQGCGLP